METKKKNYTMWFVLVGGILVVLILVLGTVWMGNSTRKDTEAAVRSVSLLYLDELAGRREQVVASNLNNTIDKMSVAITLLKENRPDTEEELQDFQAELKQLFDLEKFAFVDEDGRIHTALGIQEDIEQYPFDYHTISEPEIFIKNLEEGDKKVIIAQPVEDLSLEGKDLVVCFVEIDMDVMLQGVSMQADSNGATFCNIYTSDGIALSNQVLGGEADEANLWEALHQAAFEEGYSEEQVREDFTEGRKGVVSFTYHGIRATLAYVPVKGVNWLLTYLIRENVISDQISSISEGMVMRSLVQSLLTALVLFAMFGFILVQMRRNAKLLLEKETAETESRVKHQELEQRLALQEKLLEQEKLKARQDNLIKALSADYWSVYYLELDSDEGVCYQAHADVDNGFKVGEHFPYLASVTAYANQYITEPYREEFLAFIQPEHLREALAKERVISYRYVVHRHDRDAWEMVRFAGVRSSEETQEARIHSVGACFTDVDAETRRTLQQNQALSDALTAAEEANKAKTAFLSNMSHEIRTPMNAIIGLDNIALNDPDISDKTRDYLEKIGGSAQHLLNLINDILDMSRIESGKLTLKNEEFSISRLLSYINTTFIGQCNEKGLSYDCQVIGHLDDYYIGDAMKLRQVLINILGNAVKFTPEGGSICFTVERTAQFDGKSTLRMIIRDTGIGMSKEYLPHIFDTFSQEDSSATNKYGSSGLGLAITKNIVEMMNGQIEVESEKGKGTAFTVTVTLMDSEHSSEDEDKNEFRPGELTVLVVDDDPVACEHAKLVLEKVGIACDIALSGNEAIQMVKLRHARRDPYRLILVDWMMPEMDGIETTRQIRSIIGNDSAIIILTAYKWDDVYDEAVSAGVDSFIPKPLFANHVMDEFREALQRKHLLGEKRPNKADLKGRRILLAEDIMVNAEIMMMVLQMREMEVEHAENGRIAVEMFASHPAGYYDAILMDMRMPEMDGLEATATIRSMERDDAKAIPIIALTANAFDEDVQRSLQAGLNAHLSKPVEPDSLYETLESLIPE